MQDPRPSGKWSTSRRVASKVTNLVPPYEPVVALPGANGPAACIPSGRDPLASAICPSLECS
jgi:hypothetical protein